jgi:hypothetical protein
MRKRITLLFAALTMALTMSFGGVAFAKITPAEPPSCENPSGAMPGGQQPQCKGQGQTQNEAVPAKNPAGKAPPGQQ